jgi:signal transduction histidine kinase/CheY-like chemotaxis protein/HPt (histidine-containing phosphotransfer) domain-containing protein
MNDARKARFDPLLRHLRDARIALVLAFGLPSLGAVAAAVLVPALSPWLLPLVVMAAAAAVPAWRSLRSAPALTAQPAPAASARPSESPADADADPPTAAQSLSMRRELERLREVERQLTRAKQEADAATMAKGEFLATMSHEIRTPLNGIIPLLDILLSTPLSDDQRDYLATAYQSGQQLLSIVDDILDYSKIEANKLELESVGLNLREIVDSVTRLLAKNAESKGLRFAAAIEPNVRLAMRGDPVRLRQVLTNLVSNAIKFTERGSVSIEVKKRGETRTHSELLFSVRDTGIGLAPEVQEKLFKPFAQADASTTRVHGGTGLGLVICRRIVELMGGQIGVKSEPGRGSTFWFSVPLLKAIGDTAPARTDVSGSRALIVGTDAAMLRKVGACLSAWGVNFAQTTLPADGLAKLRGAAAMGDSWAHDFLVVDWGALRNSALSLARNVLRDPALARLRVVAISGDEEVPQEMRGTARFVALGRQFGDVELRAVLQRLIEVDAGSGLAQPVEQLLQAPGAVAAPPSAPLRAGTAAATVPPMPASAMAAGPIGGTVLLVEDNPVNRQVAQRLLGLVGVACVVAEHGQQALDRLASDRFDAILMDCQMPVMDGYAATRAIRKMESEGLRAGRMPVIAMTANAMAGDREKCLAAGMDDYMSKPLNRALLEQTLRKWLPATTATATAIGSPARAVTGPAAASRPQALSGVLAAVASTVRSVPPAIRRDAAPAIDGEVVRDLMEMMGSEFSDLVRVYLEDTPKSLAALARAAASGRVEGLVGPAHSLKSTSANLGALALSEMAKGIEQGARQGRLMAEPAVLVAEAQSEFRRVAEELGRLPGVK